MHKLKLEMADVVEAHMEIQGCPILTSNQCHTLAMKLNVKLNCDALAAQRDEGLAREQGLREELQLVTEERDHAKRNCSAFEDRMGEFQSKHGKARQECQALQQRLAEAEKLLRDIRTECSTSRLRDGRIDEFLASPGCGDGEKSSKDNCWSCGKPVSLLEWVEANGHCPYCDVEIDRADGEQAE